MILAAATPAVTRLFAAPAALLSPAERLRAAALPDNGHRADFVAAHALARLAVARALGIAAEVVTIIQRCAECGGPHGRPEVAGWPAVSVSLSHTSGYVAACAGGGAVGTDVELLPGTLDERLAAATLAPAELRLVSGLDDPAVGAIRSWVRKESFVKVGLASLERLAELDLSTLAPDEPAPLVGSRWQYAGMHGVDWRDPGCGVLGAAVTYQPATLLLLDSASGTPVWVPRSAPVSWPHRRPA